MCMMFEKYVASILGCQLPLRSHHAIIHQQKVPSPFKVPGDVFFSSGPLLERKLPEPVCLSTESQPSWASVLEPLVPSGCVQGRLSVITNDLEALDLKMHS